MKKPDNIINGPIGISGGADIRGDVTSGGSGSFKGDVAAGGALSAGKDLSVKGRARIGGDTVVKGNLRVKGWLEVDNLRLPCVGYFLSPAELFHIHPLPANGLWALVMRRDARSAFPARVFRSWGGVWVDTGKDSGLLGVRLDDALLSAASQALDAARKALDAAANVKDGDFITLTRTADGLGVIITTTHYDGTQKSQTVWNGLTPYVGENGHWWIGETDTGTAAQGEKGDKGDPGDDADATALESRIAALETCCKTVQSTLTSIEKRLSALENGSGGEETEYYTLTVNATPDDAEVYIGGETFTGTGSVTAAAGTMVEYRVSKTGYVDKIGWWTAEKDETIEVELVLDNYNFMIIATPSDARIVINGIDVTDGDGGSMLFHYGDEVTWEVSKEGYVTQSGSFTMPAATYTISVVLAAESEGGGGSEKYLDVTDITLESGAYVNMDNPVALDPYIDTDADSYTVEAADGSDWLTVGTVYTGLGDAGALGITATENDGTSARTATLLVTATWSDGTEKAATIVVTQAVSTVAFSISVTPSDATVTINGEEVGNDADGLHTVRVDKGSTVEWKCAIQGYGPQSGTETVTEDTVKDVTLADHVNVMDYGATGNYSTDATEAFKAAIKDAEEYGVWVYVPAGAYSINNVDSHVDVKCEDGSVMTGGRLNVYGGTLENCTFGSGSSCLTYEVGTVSGCTFEDGSRCEVDGGTVENCTLGSGSQCYVNAGTLTGCTFESGSYGYVDGGTIENCTFKSGSTCVIDNSGTARGCTFESGSTYNVYGDGSMEDCTDGNGLPI